MRPILLSFFPFTVRNMFLYPFTSLFTQLAELFSILFQHHISVTFKALLIYFYFPKCQLKLSDKNKHGGFHAISKFKKLCVFNPRFLVERQQYSAETWYSGLR
jgi:hypothetical protein